MPFVGFLCRECKQVYPTEPAVTHFRYAHVDVGYALPAPVIHLLAASEVGDERRTGANVSPSMALGCMREVAIKRTYDYTVMPHSLWRAQQGTIFHAGLASQARTGHLPEGWVSEVLLPPDGQPVELWPGIALTTRIDLISADGDTLEDYKTTGCFEKRGPGGVYSASHGWLNYEQQRMQLNLESLVVERVSGKRPSKLVLWGIMLGTKDADGAWQPRLAEVLPEEQICREVVEGPNGFAAFVKVMSTPEGPEREAAIKTLPLAGRTMFGGKKCLAYCAVKPQCDALLGEAERW